MAVELTELGLRLRREVEEALASVASGWALAPALDERDDLAQLHQLEREVMALAASQADAGQLFAWLTAGFFGQPLARGSVSAADGTAPDAEDGDGPPEETDGPRDGDGREPARGPAPTAPATSGTSWSPPASPGAAASRPLPAPEAAPARPGLRGLADLAAAARSTPLVLARESLTQGETSLASDPSPSPGPANGGIGITPGAESSPSRGGWAPATLSNDADTSPQAVEPPASPVRSTWVQGTEIGGTAERWTPPFSGISDSTEAGRGAPDPAGATPDVRRSQVSPGEPLPPTRGGPEMRGLAGLAALAGSRPLVFADEPVAVSGDRDLRVERTPGDAPPSPLPAPPAPVARRETAAAPGAARERIIRLLPVPVAVPEERTLPWPAATPADAWTPPFTDALPTTTESAPRAASPSPANPPADGRTSWTAEVSDPPRSPRPVPQRGSDLATALAAFAPGEAPRLASAARSLPPRASEAETPARTDPRPQATAETPPPAAPPAPPVFSTTLAPPARDGFGAADAGEPPAWPDVEVSDLLDALQREILHEYRRHYGA